MDSVSPPSSSISPAAARPFSTSSVLVSPSDPTEPTTTLPAEESDEPPMDADQLGNFVLENPRWYLENILGLRPWEKEVEIVEAVRDHMKVLVAGCVSSGKTHATAGLVLWWLAAFAPQARVFCLAPTERQLKINLWGEIPRIYRTAPVAMGGNMMPLSLQYRLDEDWFAMGFSPQDSQGVFGIHGPHDLLVIDDAQGVKEEIWGALENALAGGSTHVLASCNPIVTSGEIYDAMTTKRKEYHVIRISADDTPNVKAGRVVIPGMITKEMRDRWVEKYGKDSDFCRTKVFAQLPKQEADTLISIDWIEQAFVRETAAGKDDRVVLGVDVARFGDDETTIFPIHGNKGLPIVVLHGNDTMQVAGRVAKEMKDHDAVHAYIDVVGVGSGVVDRCAEQGLPVTGINVGEKAFNDKKFVNLRSEIWWAAREALNPENPNAVSLPNDPDLMADLAAPKWSVDSSGRIKVERKEDMKKRLGRSPDRGDAFCMAVFGRIVQTIDGASTDDVTEAGVMVAGLYGADRHPNEVPADEI